jgi:cation-transporting P-type ATPase 13A2
MVETLGWLRYDSGRILFYYISSVFTLGVIPIICFYYPNQYIKLRTTKCDPLNADYAHVICNDEEFVVEVEHYSAGSNVEHLILAEIEHIRYCASSEDKFYFRKVPEVPIHYKRYLLDHYSKIHEFNELQCEKELIRFHYGVNELLIPETSFLQLLLQYLLSPFYIFQYFSATVWFLEDYYSYAVVILLITFIAVYVTARESLMNLESLRKIAGNHSMVQLIKSEKDDITVENGGRFDCHSEKSFHFNCSF